jgi:hypothetical protein
MNENLLDLFLQEDCDSYVRSLILASIRGKSSTMVVEEFTFNRFNLLLDFGTNTAVINDELNPSYGEYRLPLQELVVRVTALGI